MAFKDEYPGLNYVLDEFFEGAGNVKLALKDGNVSPDDAVSAIPDEGVRQYVGSMLKALKQLPEEVDSIVSGGPWEMMKLFPVLAEKGKILFK